MTLDLTAYSHKTEFQNHHRFGKCSHRQQVQNHRRDCVLVCDFEGLNYRQAHINDKLTGKRNGENEGGKTKTDYKNRQA